MVRIPTATKSPEPTAADEPLPGSPPDDQAQGDIPASDAVVKVDEKDGGFVADALPPGLPAEALAAAPAGVAGPSSAGSATGLPDGAGPAVATPHAPADVDQRAAPPVDDRRPLRVVLTCKPAGDQRWTAFIAVGRIDGLGKPSPVDPVFETLECETISDALDAVAGVYAAAEARWAQQPRNAPAALATPAKREHAAKEKATAERARQDPGGSDTGKGAKKAVAPAAPKPSAPPPPPIGEKLTLF